MRDQIKAYEEQAKAIEPNAEQRCTLREAIVNYTEQFLENIHDLEKIPAFQVHDTGIDLTKQPISDNPIELEKAIELIAKSVDREGLNPASGGHFGYIPGGGIYSSSLGDYWADITNRYAGVFFANSGAVRMENHLINWMKELVGYPESALGNLASGGSIANLTAIVAARDTADIRAHNISRHVIYLSKQAHHCINKAIHIAGLKECQVRHISLNDRFKMDMDALKETIAFDIKNGLKPWLLVGSAGTTDTGAIDPLNDMAQIAQKHEMWFHIDAAYGGFFMLTDYGKRQFHGIERSDSLVMDPHKGLFLPYGIGVVIVKNGEALRNSFTYKASYMQDISSLADECFSRINETF
ncbi:aminotransferase class V-fold PLP-dependent enzyme [Fulvivirga sp. 29W222]|uniref:Aminotransferase class V-fold PLP-dependent enzyme n=1 Tax=Fulvivirga marina TaxID=2494733 RepID=A0A937FZU1_9BACT|nr:aminotransferase class V-fold PLP-dependent enzyme [Fulvivirga marina]MBL6447390.1 aminotransferase class V-fold PLP-dependent enzyme [Fulvivirga marina]